MRYPNTLATTVLLFVGWHVLLLPELVASEGGTETKIIYEGEWGEWQGFSGVDNYSDQECFVCGAEIRYDGTKGGGWRNDKTAANGLRVTYCHIDDWNDQIQNVLIEEGMKGEWMGMVMCPFDSYVDGGAVRFDDPPNGNNGNTGKDETALNGLKVHCRHKETDETSYELVWGGDKGSWKNEVVVSEKFVKLVNVRQHENGEDLTGMNGLMFLYETPSPAEPTPEPAPYPTPYPTPEPTPESTPYPTPEPTPEPTPFPTPYPTPAPTPEPTPYATPEPTPEPTPYPTPVSEEEGDEGDEEALPEDGDGEPVPEDDDDEPAPEDNDEPAPEDDDEPLPEGDDDEPLPEGDDDEPLPEGDDDEPIPEGDDDEPLPEGDDDEPIPEGDDDGPIPEVGGDDDPLPDGFDDETATSLTPSNDTMPYREIILAIVIVVPILLLVCIVGVIMVCLKRSAKQASDEPKAIPEAIVTATPTTAPTQDNGAAFYPETLVVASVVVNDSSSTPAGNVDEEKGLPQLGPERSSSPAPSAPESDEDEHSARNDECTALPTKVSQRRMSKSNAKVSKFSSRRRSTFVGATAVAGPTTTIATTSSVSVVPSAATRKKIRSSRSSWLSKQ